MSIKNEPTNLAKVDRLRRAFSDADKAKIVKELEAPNATISGVARKHKIGVRLLRAWRKQFSSEQQNLHPANSLETMDLLSTYKAMLATDRSLEALIRLAAGNVAKDLKSGESTAYTNACSVHNIVSAVTKIQDRICALVEQIASLEKEKAKERAKDPIDFEIERKAEKMCYELVRADIMRDRAMAAKASQNKKEKN